MKKEYFSISILVGISFILFISSCSNPDEVEILFFGREEVLLRIKPDNKIKFYQKNGRLKAIEITEAELIFFKKYINSIRFVSLQINSKEIYRFKWYTLPHANILVASRASIYHSRNTERNLMIFSCADNSIELDNCFLDVQLNQKLLDYLDEKQQLHAISLLNLNDYGRVRYPGFE